MKVASIFLKTVLFISIFFLSALLYSQTNQCNNNAVGEVTVGASCTTSIFDLTNNNDYWNSATGCNAGDYDDAWVWFDATATSTTIDYFPLGTENPILTLFEGACSQTMASIDCANANGNGGQETITYATTIGNRYHVRIQRNNSNADMLGDICVYSAGGGGGGGGADAAWPGSDLGTLTCAGTTSVSDNTTGANIDCASSFNGDHIYQFTLGTSADLTLSVCGAAWDTYLELYNLANGDCDGVNIGSDDDGCGALQSTISMSCLSAGDYVVVVNGYAEGAYTLDLTTSDCSCTPPAPTTAPDCTDAVHICTNANFQIDPNGIGVAEIPTSGSLGNPLDNNPGGSGNFGCLQSDENNSTWMVVNISAGGNLEFTFGGAATQAGFYDWIMYDYDATSCADIPANTEAPVRCNWNGVDNGGTGLADNVPAGGDASNFEPALPVLAGDQYVICFSNYSAVSTAVPLDFGGTATVSCTPLPVDLLNFNVEVIEENQGARCSWSTVSEVNNDYFLIERSNDGELFFEIGRVQGAGNNNGLLNYEFIDDYSFLGMSYYRLKQVDFDGEVEFSSVASLELIESLDVVIYPNPTNMEASVVGVALGSQLQLVDVFGKVLMSRRVKSAIEKLELAYLINGIYFLKIFNQDEIEIKKLIIEH